MWTEEARRAAAEARKASNKAYSNDSDVLHDKARAANEKAADLAPAKEKNTFQDAADKHSSVAGGLRAAHNPSEHIGSEHNVAEPRPGQQGYNPYKGAVKYDKMTPAEQAIHTKLLNNGR